MQAVVIREVELAADHQETSHWAAAPGLVVRKLQTLI